jgi:hypothetical protein
MGRGRKAVEPILRFNKKYIVDPESQCWYWTGCKNENGYGQFRVGNVLMKAHRFAYEYFIGALDPELEICHNCSNSSCVNPRHLRQDTRSSNMIDMSYAGTNCMQKLSVEQVIEIKKRLQNYYFGLGQELATEYGVDYRTISVIKTGKNWKHLDIS